MKPSVCAAIFVAASTAGLAIMYLCYLRITAGLRSERRPLPKGGSTRPPSPPPSPVEHRGCAGRAGVSVSSPVLSPRLPYSPALLLVLVSSRAENARSRHVIRSTYGSIKRVKDEAIRTVYVLGRSANRSAEIDVRDESAEFGDVLQFDFDDNYRNLTTKTILGLCWAVNDYNAMRYLMKVDEDVIINMELVVDYLLSFEPPQRYTLYAGYVWSGAKPVRNRDDKYFVPFEEYAGSIYPNYVAGPSYVLSTFAAKLVIEQSKYQPLLTMEDVYVGICANSSGLAALHCPKFGNSILAAYGYCQIKSMLAVHGADDLYKLRFWEDRWSDINGNSTFSC